MAKLPAELLTASTSEQSASKVKKKSLFMQQMEAKRLKKRQGADTAPVSTSSTGEQTFGGS